MTAPTRSRVDRLAAGTARALVLLLLGGLLSAGLTVTTAAPAAAAARITVTNDRGGATADLRHRTRLTVRGTGFQAVRGGFGGVYLMFGWVDDPRGGTWKPSRGGITGKDYRYIPDSEDVASNQGYLRFIAFPGSSTASEANAVLSARGGFSVSLTVPGPTFQSIDRNGNVVAVDCRKVTCGVITIGAHGVKSPANETFTPVRFTDLQGASPDQAEQGQQGQPGQSGADGSGSDRLATPDGTQDAAAGEQRAGRARTGPPEVTTDRRTARVGHTLAFTATGFTPGEQVLGVLDDGLAGIGPMVAGPSGEVAAILPLPADLPPGTHELRLTGAASGGSATERFAVRAATPAPEAVAPSAGADEDTVAASRVFLLVAGAVLALAVLGAVLRASLLRRRGRRARPTTAGVA